MKKSFSILLVLFTIFLFISCSHNHNTSEDTVKVIVSNNEVSNSVSFTLYDEEAEIYKQFSITENDYFNINHFKKGTYKMLYKRSFGSYTYSTYIESITINRPSKIEFYLVNDDSSNAIRTNWTLKYKIETIK